MNGSVERELKFQAPRACALRERLSWLQDGLSAARDADVLIASLLLCSEALPDADRRDVDDLLGRFRAERKAAYERVGAMLRDAPKP